MMPRTRECDFCGDDIEPGTGTMFVRTNGATIHYCSSKCEKNHDLGREARNLEWTEAGRPEERPEESADEETAEPEPAAEPTPDLEAAEADVAGDETDEESESETDVDTPEEEDGDTDDVTGGEETDDGNGEEETEAQA